MAHSKMINQDTLSFKKVSEQHISMLFSWLNSPHLKGVYDNGYSSLEELKSKYLSSEGGIQRFVVSNRSGPFGYIQSYDIGVDHSYAEFCHPEGITVGIDFFIGEPGFLGKGYGFELLRRFIGFLGRDIDRVLVDPINGNSSINLFFKYGFKEVGEVISVEGVHRLLAIDIRYTARALIVNEEGKLLLMKFEDPRYEDVLRKNNCFWCTIGGKIEKNEDELQAIKREIAEETGIENFIVRDLAFYGDHTLMVSKFPTRHFEKYYFVDVFKVSLHQKNLTDNEREIFRDICWWSLQELLATKEIFYPRSLAEELMGVKQGGEIPKEIAL